MTMLEEMTVAFLKAERDCTGPRDWVVGQGMVEALKVLRTPSEAVLDAAYSDEKTTLENWQSAIDAVLKDAP